MSPVRRVKWDAWFLELLRFKKAHGHCRVPSTVLGLGSWVRRARAERPRGLLSAEQVHRLDEIGFDWSAREAVWRERVGELADFKQRYGHCDVPSDSKKHRTLAAWVKTQRTRSREGSLTSERAELLRTLGLAMDSEEMKWLNRFDELKAFKKRYGHCNIPIEAAKYRKLRAWFVHQRNRHRLGKLARHREQKLIELGVIWYPPDTGNHARWEKRLAELSQFKAEFGHCQVPQNWPENKPLANWVCCQRTNARRRRLTDEQKRRLNALGFEWEVTSWPATRTKTTDTLSKRTQTRTPKQRSVRTRK